MKLPAQQGNKMLFSVLLIHFLLFLETFKCDVYDLIVVGLGSGGLAAARRAASYGAKIAVIEKNKIGGTCVNAGCVPKKILWTAANLAHLKQLYSKYGLFESIHQYKSSLGEVHQKNGLFDEIGHDTAFANLYLNEQRAFFEMEVNRRARDSYIDRIQKSYKKLFSNLSSVDLYLGFEVVSLNVGSTLNIKPSPVKSVTFQNVNDDKKSITLQGSKVLLATGSRPVVPMYFQRGITSDEFWVLPGPTVPQTVVVVGGGYIAVEMASILKALGSERVVVVVKKDRLLSSFDNEMVNALQTELMEGQGIEIYYQHYISEILEPSNPLLVSNKACARVVISNQLPIPDSVLDSSKQIDKDPLEETFMVHFPRKEKIIPKEPSSNIKNINSLDNFDDKKSRPLGNLNYGEKRLFNSFSIDADLLIWAIGRKPNTDIQGIPDQVKDSKNGLIMVNETTYESDIPGLYAIGDIIKGAHLTPVAIASGRSLADQIFGNKTPFKGELPVPTVVFTIPSLATIGLSEEEAIEKYGKESIRIYSKTFTPMIISAVSNIGDPIRKRTNKYKLVCLEPQLKVIGIHILGPYSEEIIQGFAVAMTTGHLTKNIIDSTIALHPTMAEELLGLN